MDAHIIFNNDFPVHVLIGTEEQAKEVLKRFEQDSIGKINKEYGVYGASLIEMSYWHIHTVPAEFAKGHM